MNRKLISLIAVLSGAVVSPTMLSGAAIGALTVMIAANPAVAAKVPDAEEQEYLVKATLLSFNDANITGLYDVLLAKTAAPFREQFTAEKLAAAFREFRERHMNIGRIVEGMEINFSGPGEINDDGVLLLHGTFPTEPKTLSFALKFVRSEGEWKPLGIKVDNQ
jgi:hypothetical protein